MKKKNLFLFAAIITFMVFIGYMSEPGPHMLFGYSLNIWIVRLVWLVISLSNFRSYLNAKKPEN